MNALAVQFAIGSVAIGWQSKPMERPVRSVDFGPEVMASINDEGGSLRCEPSVALHGDHVVVAWNDSYGGAHGARTGVLVGWSFSVDGGKTYQSGGYLPSPEPEASLGSADAHLTTDADGNFYLTVLVWQKSGHEIRTFFIDHAAIGSFENRGRVDGTNGKPRLDKPDLTTWGNGKLAVAYTRGSEIAVAVSNDGGRGWLPPTIVSKSANGLRTGAAVRAEGNTLVVAWLEGDGVELTELWSAVSTDGGQSFMPATRVQRLAGHVAPLSGYAMGVGPASFMANDVALAVRPGSPARFFLAAIEGTKQGSCILLFESESELGRWSKPVTVGQSPDTGGKAFLTMTLVDDRPALLCYDRREHGDS